MNMKERLKNNLENFFLFFDMKKLRVIRPEIRGKLRLVNLVAKAMLEIRFKRTIFLVVCFFKRETKQLNQRAKIIGKKFSGVKRTENLKRPE